MKLINPSVQTQPFAVLSVCKHCDGFVVGLHCLVVIVLFGMCKGCVHFVVGVYQQCFRTMLHLKGDHDIALHEFVSILHCSVFLVYCYIGVVLVPRSGPRRIRLWTLQMMVVWLSQLWLFRHCSLSSDAVNAKRLCHTGTMRRRGSSSARRTTGHALGSSARAALSPSALVSSW